jgi:isopropylmalate/homocitrate/citramalate synthase
MGNPVEPSGTMDGGPFPEPSANRVEILECTLRDGSYAVDFKFTERDTEVLAGVLAGLGFRWIEVGHGLGLGAAQAGKGAMPASDERLIEAAKRAAPHAMIGSFFIPGIGKKEQLRSARSAGLDFVRIGYNAPEVEEAYPYVEFARELGLIPCLNFMKTYGVTPAEFARRRSWRESKAGAEVIYCVDSAGSMFPEDVRRYMIGARASAASAPSASMGTAICNSRWPIAWKPSAAGARLDRFHALRFGPKLRQRSHRSRGRGLR